MENVKKKSKNWSDRAINKSRSPRLPANHHCQFVGNTVNLFPSGSCNAETQEIVGSISGSGRSPGDGHGNPLQYSCWENPMDRGVWWAMVHGVAKSQTRLKQLSTYNKHKNRVQCTTTV